MSAINELRRSRGLHILQERFFKLRRVYFFLGAGGWHTSAQMSVPQCDCELKCSHVARVVLMLYHHHSGICGHTTIPGQSNMIIPCLLSCNLWKS